MTHTSATDQPDASPTPGGVETTTRYIPLPEASAMAKRVPKTLKRAIARGDLIARRASTKNNATYEIEERSLLAWIGPRENPDPVEAKGGTSGNLDPATHPSASSPGTKGSSSDDVPTSEAQGPTSEAQEPTTKREHPKMPPEARRLRRWKNYMRSASPEQMLSMISWLSARLRSVESTRRGKLKPRLKQARNRKKTGKRSKNESRATVAETSGPNNKKS